MIKVANELYSIVIPVYNTPIEYLDKCLDSLTNQTYHNIEIIIVDDGSNDETSEACNKYSEKDSRVKIIHQKNQGVSAARNNGILNASGEWIMFVDADDWLELDACEQLSEILKAKRCDIIMFNHVRNYAGRQVTMKYGLIPDKMYNMNDVSDKELLYKRAMGVPDAKKGWSCILTYIWDKVYSRKFLRKNTLLFPVGLPKSEDKVFVLSCFEKMSSLYYFEHCFYHYRMNDSSICNRYSKEADQYREELVEKLEIIASRMDEEIGLEIGDKNYNAVSNELVRYIFGLISDVLLLKYFHKDNPSKFIERRKEAVNFISTEPFKSSISKVRYSDLSKDAKLKKFMLTLKLVASFCYIKRTLGYINGRKIGKIRVQQ